MPRLIFSFTKNVKQTMGNGKPFYPLLKYHVIYERRMARKKVTVKWTHALKGHCTVARSVTWPLIGGEAGGDLVLIQTLLLLLCKSSCSYAN